MAMSAEEKREAERLKKRRQRERARSQTTLTAVPPLGPDEGTDEGTGSVVPASNLDAVQATFKSWEIPADLLYLATQAVTLARGLDDLSRVPQHASLSARLTETMAALRKASMPRERSWLDQVRDEFPRGGLNGSGNKAAGS